jgi:alpha-galactosidase
MSKIVFIGAGSGFGATLFVDIMSYEDLRESEVVLVDVNPKHLGPVEAYCRKVVEHYREHGGASTKVTAAPDWRGGVLDGADYVITSFAQGGPAYGGYPYAHEILIPQKYGIHQNIADTVGFGGVFRTMRTAPELLAIGKDLEKRSPGSCLINYVNPMSMLTRAMNLACPGVRTYGLCHNVQGDYHAIARWLGVEKKDIRFVAAGVNHMDWFLRLEYADGRDAYPDLRKAAENDDIRKSRTVQFELLKQLGYWTTESAGHCAEYIPYFMPRKEDREAMGLGVRGVKTEAGDTAPRWGPESDLVQQLEGRKELRLARSHEYGTGIILSFETDAVRRMNINVMNHGMIENLPDGYCVEVTCTVDRTGLHPHYVGALPVHLAALCRGMADMQTLASDAFLEKDLKKAYLACVIDPTTAASTTPAKIRECFNELAEAEREWLEPYWGKTLSV